MNTIGKTALIKLERMSKRGALFKGQRSSGRQKDRHSYD
jgi:hypothetical protein